MNELHLKYKMETGDSVYEEAASIKIDRCYQNLSKYIEWLEEKVENKK